MSGEIPSVTFVEQAETKYCILKKADKKKLFPVPTINLRFMPLPGFFYVVKVVVFTAISYSTLKKHDFLENKVGKRKNGGHYINL